jgi:DNA adenine methylase
MYRLGNKASIAEDVIKHFPKHSIYVEPFFGIGGIYFNKELVRRNILNDLDADIHNLFMLTTEEKKLLFETLDITPIATATFEYLKETRFECKVMRALRFIYLSSFSLFGAGGTMMIGNIVRKTTVIEKTKELLKHRHIKRAQFTTKDFREFFSSLSIHNHSRNSTFVYNDPPYLGLSSGKYGLPMWNKKDFDDLLQLNLKARFKFAVSEFENSYVKSKAEEFGLRIIDVCTRKNVRTKSKEILIVNY